MIYKLDLILVALKYGRSACNCGSLFHSLRIVNHFDVSASQVDEGCQEGVYVEEVYVEGGCV